MNKVKLTIEIPTGNYCDDCPCLGLNGNEEEQCGYFNKPLKCKGIRAVKCDECKLMTRMLIKEGGGQGE